MLRCDTIERAMKKLLPAVHGPVMNGLCRRGSGVVPLALRGVPARRAECRGVGLGRSLLPVLPTNTELRCLEAVLFMSSAIQSSRSFSGLLVRAVGGTRGRAARTGNAADLAGAALGVCTAHSSPRKRQARCPRNRS